VFRNKHGLVPTLLVPLLLVLLLMRRRRNASRTVLMGCSMATGRMEADASSWRQPGDGSMGGEGGGADHAFLTDLLAEIVNARREWLGPHHYVVVLLLAAAASSSMEILLRVDILFLVASENRAAAAAAAAAADRSQGGGGDEARTMPLLLLEPYESQHDRLDLGSRPKANSKNKKGEVMDCRGAAILILWRIGRAAARPFLSAENQHDPWPANAGGALFGADRSSTA
jgi:hypothetical protein